MRAALFDTHEFFKEFTSADFKEKQAKVIVNAIDKSREKDLSYFATKEDIIKLEARVSNIEKNMATKEDIAKVRTAIKESSNSQIRWLISLLAISLIPVITLLVHISMKLPS